MTTSRFIIIDTDTKLHNLRKILMSKDTLALDMEFHAENRYLPKLMLIQLADLDKNIWIVDPIAIDISSLSSVLKNKIFLTHGGQEDIRLLYAHLSVTPQKIFDTQIAAAFTGIHYPARLNTLLEKSLQQKVMQHETLSDWSKRPLKSQQLQYAAEDVSSLVDLYTHYQSILGDQEAWVWEASKEMLHSSLNRTIEEWRSWKVVQQFDNTTKNILVSLLNWREETAQRKNKPANYILPRNIIIDLVRRKPKSIQEIRLNRRINHGLIKNHGQEILAMIAKGRRSTHRWPTIQYSDIAREKLILAWSTCFSESCGIASDLIMPANLAQRIAQHGVCELTGWRRKMLHDDLVDFLNGTTAIGLQNNVPQIVAK
ncbi:MAG: HRDC domain-containing protein [Myxococcota bacterium]|nr:HRDC domain-containing protein [Myxococcota bacterium]